MKALEELVAEIRATPVHRLARVLAALRGIDPVTHTVRVRGSALPKKFFTLEEVADRVLAMPIKGSLFAAIERTLVQQALVLTMGNKSEAARLLGVDRKVIDRKMARYAPLAPVPAWSGAAQAEKKRLRKNHDQTLRRTP